MNNKSFSILLGVTILITIIAIFSLYRNTGHQPQNVQKQDIINNQPESDNSIIKTMDKLFKEENELPYLYVPMGLEWITVNENWKIRLDSIEFDNRCPSGVVCEVSGSAMAKVQFMQPNVDYTKAYFENMEVQGLNRFPPTGELKENLFKPVQIKRTDSEGKDIGFQITLVDLAPYPEKNNYEVLPDDYVGLFKIEELK